MVPSLALTRRYHDQTIGEAKHPDKKIGRLYIGLKSNSKILMYSEMKISSICRVWNLFLGQRRYAPDIFHGRGQFMATTFATAGAARRLLLLAAASLAIALPLSSTSQAADKVIRIGFQKYGNVILLKGRGSLEGKLAPLGYKVEWKEFPSGPPLVEALNVGAIDFGHAGEAPPIFGQAAGAGFVYVGNEPAAPRGEAVLVPKSSLIRTLRDLKGKKVALNKGSNVHYLLVKALEKAGLRYGDIEPAFLAPADARAAFERGAVDAWAIWDPFQAAAEAATGARTLTTAEGIAPNYQFYLAGREFTAANPGAIDAVLDAIAEVDRWATGNEAAVARELSAGIGIPAAILEASLKRQSFGVTPVGPNVIAAQQQVADTFFALGLLPKAIAVKDAARSSSP